MKNYILNLKVKTVSPLAIIENSDSDARSGVITYIKKTGILTNTYEGKKVVNVPYIPANGIRGSLRRLATKKLIEHVKQNTKATEIKDTDIHAMLSGSGVTSQPTTYEEELEIREKNPLLSVFGSGLVLSGKMYVADGLPEEEFYKGLIRKETYVKVDDILAKTKYSNLFTKEQIAEWELSVGENSEARAEDRKLQKMAKELGEKIEKEKTKKTSIQHYAQREYIVTNSEFFSSIKLENVTELELGMFLHALESYVEYGRMGSTNATGFGIVDLFIADETKNLSLSRIANDDYVFNAKVDLVFTGEFKKAYDAYSNFLSKVTLDNVELFSKI